MIHERELAGLEAGVVGLGLMGSSIAVALTIAGHPVRAVAPLKNELTAARKTIRQLLQHAAGSGLLQHSPEYYLNRMTLSEDFKILKNCSLVQECVVEDKAIKAAVYEKISAHTREQAVISSNTSAIPVSLLQELVPDPGRFLGIHWAEPAYLTRFMEITRGRQTRDSVASWVVDLAHCWGKEPTFLQKDIRGFVTNRLMYAVYRELFTLVAAGETTMEDADKAFRYDAGSWMSFMGLFERMDQLGLEDFLETFSRLFPELGNASEVPEIMQQIVRNKARGTQEARGLYAYTPEGAAAWENAFAEFNKEIYHLADRYQELKNG
ncbi:3-hydroxyacyl-CoA dehydrogenase family protein [Cyclobacterium jeungdonense]|uniref:3-hydroxyacyl-CoA dehydrogenase family protein n=1 Tax=Cyclobacterium jeungdonense TaxID=708087 RepID=A0ABT8C8B5_9BACT|nr:3-hydroxyacyl-CoA dehydrogenase family protein [Cyclobacterium jeungdonense]MDN3688775.1 3-hydroxyacyl-CoA dehydrogenase family protein [Cyclobacterium jeungdonense]